MSDVESAPGHGAPFSYSPGESIATLGSGFVGDKATALASAETDSGFSALRLERRLVLSEEVLDRIVRHNGLGEKFQSADIDEMDRPLTLPPEIGAVIRRFLPETDSPILIRSCADKDARGTGVYHSAVCLPGEDEIGKSLTEVLQRYFTTRARDYREQVSADDGFSVILEGCVGNECTTTLDEKAFAPLLSGIAYSSTPRSREPSIELTAGLFGGVSHPGNVVVTPERWAAQDEDLIEYIAAWPRYQSEDKEHFAPGAFHPSWNASSTLDDEEPTVRANVWLFEGREGRPPGIEEAVTIEAPSELRERGVPALITELFEILRAEEIRTGKRQYVEWAMSMIDGEPAMSLLQLAEVPERELKAQPLEVVREPIIVCDSNVVGSATIECEYLAFCPNYDGIAELAAFNATHDAYALLYGGGIVTRYPLDLAGGSHDELREAFFNGCSRASVFFETDGEHVGSVAAHFEGYLDATGKLFGKKAKHPGIGDILRTLGTPEMEQGGFYLYRGPFIIVADQRAQRMVLGLS